MNTGAGEVDSTGSARRPPSGGMFPKDKNQVEENAGVVKEVAGNW